jgi:hypothetical protein
MEYALCWRQSPVVLFPLKEKEKRQKDEKQKQENLKIPSNWDLLSSLSLPTLPPPPPSNSLPHHSFPDTRSFHDCKRS